VRSSLIPFVLAVVAGVLFPSTGYAQGLNWDIDSFETEVTVNTDGSFDVIERIDVDFTREPHHGIYRDIPYAYRRHGTSYNVRIGGVSVGDGGGGARPFEVSRSGGMVRLKIGRGDKKVSGVVTYVIGYTVRRAMLSFANHDEVYWNATGTNWPVPIERATCTVHLPTSVPSDQIGAASYTGAFGSTREGPDPIVSSGPAVRFESGRLGAFCGLTVVLGVPKGHIDAPTASTRVGWFIADNWIIVIPFVVFPVLLVMWRRFGRDLGTPGSIPVSYEPPDGLTPIEIGTIIDERVDTRDVTATIIDFAVRGVIRIDASKAPAKGAPDPEDVRLIKLKDDDESHPLQRFERDILDKLFGVKDEVWLEDIRYKFYDKLPGIKTDVHGALAKKGYFDGNIRTIRHGWMGFGVVGAIAIAVLGFFAIATDTFPPVTAVLAAALTAPQFPIFAWFMPRKTARGRRTLERVRGLEEYLARTEPPEIEHAERLHHFERLLPYAMALNVSDAWARKFEGIYDAPPEWYAAPTTAHFSTLFLATSLAHSSSTMSDSLAAAPRSQGGFSSGGAGGGSSGFSGGFSGGGFGGGGGGAW